MMLVCLALLMAGYTTSAQIQVGVLARGHLEQQPGSVTQPEKRLAAGRHQVATAGRYFERAGGRGRHPRG